MENKALHNACEVLKSTLLDLRDSMDDTQEMYHNLFVQSLSVPKSLRNTLEYLYKAEQTKHSPE